jgi:hypothetical protein
MGADAFITFYGIEYSVPAGSDVSSLEKRTDERIVRARRAKLDTWWGCVSDGRDFHLLIGKKIADLGLEGQEQVSVTNQAFTSIQEEVKQKLSEAGFSHEPRLLFKLEAQY